MKRKRTPPPSTKEEEERPPPSASSAMAGKRPLSPTSSAPPPSAMEEEGNVRSSPPPSPMKDEGNLRLSPPPPVHTSNTTDAVIGSVATENRVRLFREAAFGSSSVLPIVPTTLAEQNTKHGISSLTNAGVGPSTLVKNNFSSLEVDRLVQDKEWDRLESYVKSFIPDSNPEKCHPMLFLSIRMSRVDDLIVRKQFAAAQQYYNDHMQSVFEILIAQGEVYRNANVADLSNGLAHIAKCLSAKESLPHLYTSNTMTKIVVNDYMRLYLPKDIGYILRGKKDELWAFGFPLQSKSSSKPTFRCLVCSVKVFSSGPIKDLAEHLEHCPRMNTEYVLELLKHCKDMKYLNKTQSVAKSVQEKRPGTKKNQYDPTPPAGTTIPAEKQDILSGIWSEIGAAEALHRDIKIEMDGVIDLHNTMATKVRNIAGKHAKMGDIVKKLKVLACPGPSVPSVRVLAPAYSAATEDEGNDVEVKEASDSLPHFDIAYLRDELTKEMQRNAVDPTYELVDENELVNSFINLDAADQVFLNK